MSAPSGPPAASRPPQPALWSRVLAGVVGGAGALTVTITLAIAQAGGAATEQASTRPVDAAAAPRGVGGSGTTSTAPPTPVTVDPGGQQAARRPVTSAAPASALAAGGIPATALSAYRHAARSAPSSCHLPWALLAGIGRVESDHGRFGGAVLHTDGVSTPAIIGIPLNGTGTEVVHDTDHGRLDGDTTYDRAVGPMQFIPSTWATWGRDANGDGTRDPFNLYDAAAASAAYLCAAGGDLGTAVGQRTAVLTYNHSTDYLTEVLGLEKIYAKQFGAAIPALPAIPRPAPSAAKAAASTARVPSTSSAASSSRPATGSSTRPGPSGAPSSTRSPSGGTPTKTPTCPSPSTTAPTTPTTPSTTAPTTAAPTAPTSSTPAPTASSSGSPSAPAPSCSTGTTR